MARVLARRGRNTQEILEALWPLRASLQRLRCRGVIVRANGASYLYDSDDLINLKIALVGAHEFDTTRFICTRLLPTDVFVDVGANLGYFSVLAARLLTKGEVIAIEPSPRSFATLRMNIDLNRLNNVRTVMRILWRESGHPVDLRVVDPYNLGANSILGTGETEAQDVSITLDDLAVDLQLERMDVIKIDVEGAELDVLLGARRCLRELKPRLVILALDHREEGTRRAAFDLIRATGYGEVDPFTSAARSPRENIARSLLFFERTDPRLAQQ